MNTKNRNGKSIIDLQNQYQRICNILEYKYATYPKDSLKRKHGLFLWNKNHDVYRKYTERIVKYLGGTKKVTGNMKLLTRKVDKSIYMG